MNSPADQPASSYVTCRCQYCDKGIEFDASTFDKGETRTVPCPHCGLETIIFVPEQKVPPVIPDENIVERAEKQLSKPPSNFGRIGEDEEIIQQCIEIIRSKKEASVSLLNRHLKLGYTRAAQIMDELANRGIVGPFKSAAEPRDILIDLNNGGYLRGDAQWQTDLGIAYFRQKDYCDAVKCFAKAAEQGHHEAQCSLGVCYMDGLGVAKDETEAVKWIFKAAEQGVAHAEYSLGVAYFFGRGVSKDFPEALKWWRRAAEHGHADAQYNLAICYEKGDGVTQDYVEAYKWIKLAAAQGFEGAQKNCEALLLKMNAEQIGVVEPTDQMLWKGEHQTPKLFSDFIGQNRVKARLELATAAAKHRREPLGHVLLIGSPGAGKTQPLETRFYSMKVNPANCFDGLLPCRPFPSLLTDEYKFHDNPSLIRFMSCEGVFDLIRNRHLRFSSVSRFRNNDPTEGLGGLPLRPHMLGFGRILYGSEGTSFTDKAKPTKHFPAHFWDEVSHKDYGSLREKIIWAKQTSENFLCNCFHIYHEEPYHMWEQYGARGAGLAIYTNKEAVLDALPSELQDNLVLGWGEMFYAFNLAEAAQLWDDAYLPESLIRIKSSRFKNEQEFRFFVRTKKTTEHIYFPFNPEAIEAIIVGPRLSSDERTRIRSELLAAVQSERLTTQIIDSEETQIRKLVEE